MLISYVIGNQCSRRPCAISTRKACLFHPGPEIGLASGLRQLETHGQREFAQTLEMFSDINGRVPRDFQVPFGSLIDLYLSEEVSLKNFGSMRRIAISLLVPRTAQTVIRATYWEFSLEHHSSIGVKEVRNKISGNCREDRRQ